MMCALTDKEMKKLPLREKSIPEEMQQYIANVTAERDRLQRIADNMTRHIEEMLSEYTDALPYARVGPEEAAVDYCSNHPGRHHRHQLRNALSDLGCAPQSKGDKRLQAISLGITHAVKHKRLKEDGDYVWLSTSPPK
jgi:predicted chitinase